MPRCSGDVFWSSTWPNHVGYSGGACALNGNADPWTPRRIASLLGNQPLHLAKGVHQHIRGLALRRPRKAPKEGGD